MKNKITKGLFFLILGYIILFTIKLIFSYFDASTSLKNRFDFNIRSFGSSNIQKDTIGFRNNIASYKQKMTFDGKTVNVNQKYEKSANIVSQSHKFDEDEKLCRNHIKDHEGIIQYEQNSGLSGERELKLLIGVHPEKFDEMVHKLKDIGKQVSFQIDKIDKTNEYRRLKAERETLERSLNRQKEFLNQNGSIAEKSNIQSKIESIEAKILRLDVNLKEYDEEQEFTTIKFALFERLEKQFTKLLFETFTWTTKYYALLIVILFFGFLTILIILKITDLLKWLPQYIEPNKKE